MKDMKQKAEEAQKYLNELFGISFRINVRPNVRKLNPSDPFSADEIYQTQLEFEGYIPGPGRQREMDEQAAREEAARAAEIEAKARAEVAKGE